MEGTAVRTQPCVRSRGAAALGCRAGWGHRDSACCGGQEHVHRSTGTELGARVGSAQSTGDPQRGSCQDIQAEGGMCSQHEELGIWDANSAGEGWGVEC